MGQLVDWVGLVVPHLGRLLVGADHDRLLPACLLIGGIFLLLVDTVARDLAFRHPGARQPVFAGLSLALRPGRILTILGPNGAGKSTLLRCLAGLARRSAGMVEIGGQPLTAFIDAGRARRLAFMAQSEGEAFAFSVAEIVLIGRAAHLGLFSRPGQADRRRASLALDRLGIAHLAQRPITVLGGGEQQLVRRARALAQDSPILLLAEPTAHLDLANQRWVLNTVRSLAAGSMSIAMSSHDPSHALACGGEALALGHSRAIAGSVAEIVSATLLAEVYGLPIEILRTMADRRPPFQISGRRTPPRTDGEAGCLASGSRS